MLLDHIYLRVLRASVVKSSLLLLGLCIEKVVYYRDDR